MKTILITITAPCPAPRSREYKIEATSFQAGIGRAIRQFRKDLGRKKMTELNIKAIVLNHIKLS